MTIIVATQACRTSGALTIYRQFLSHLAENVNGHRWILFIDPSMDHPIIEGVEYVFDSGHSWRERIRWNRKGLLNWLEEKRISPDCIVSLQNTGVITDCPQVIYYHQSIPFYSKKWNIFKSSERIMWAYKHVYPYFVKETLNPKTEVVVQIPFIKHGFCKRFKFAPSKIHILFPDVNLPAVEDVEPADDGYTHFIYPATPLPYKGHNTIVDALSALKQRDLELAEKIKVHFTITRKDAESLINAQKLSGVEDMLVFEGSIPFKDLLLRYRSYSGLLFPSSIETLGLPLVEAANFGLPVIANDLPYAREVLEGYNGVEFISISSVEKWAGQIRNLAHHKKRYPPLKLEKSSWKDFFDLIEKVVAKWNPAD